MTKYYYADKDKNPVGPHTFAELKELARQGVIGGATNVIVEGGASWMSWEELNASESRAEVAANVVARASQIGEQLKGYDWGSFVLGLLLVLVECLLLPWSLLRRAGEALSDWGRNRTLPTSTSDVPVLTFLVIVTRPAAHVLWTAYYSLKACIFLANGKIETSLFGLFNTYRQVDFPDRLYYFLGICVAIYFANFVIGLVFDALSLLVGMANSLKKIEKK